MTDLQLIDYEHCYQRQILALNLLHEHKLSPMDAAQLTDFVEHTASVTVLLLSAEFAGYAITVEPNSSYSGVNFQWFKQRYSNFVYLDRIVVANEFQGGGLGSAYYRQLSSVMRQRGKSFIGIEVNSQPLNLQSMNFHTSIGFKAVGKQRLDSKAVTYLTRQLSQ